MSRSHSYASKYTTIYECSTVRRNTQEQKCVNDLRSTRKSKISIWQQKFLGTRILRRYRRKEREVNRKLYQESARRRLRKGSDITKRVRRPVYG